MRPLTISFVVWSCVSLVSAIPAAADHPNDLVNPPVAEPELNDNQHVEAALRHLEAAGLPQAVRIIKQHAQQKLRARQVARKHAEIKALQKEIDRLQGEIREIESPQSTREAKQIQIDLKVIEVAVDKLPKSKRGQDRRSIIELLAKQPEVTENNSNQVWVGTLDADASLKATLDHLRARGAVKVLAEPMLVAEAGRPATFHSGGQTPVVGNDGRVEFVDFGTKIEVVAHVLANGEIGLHLRPSITEVEEGSSKVRSSAFESKVQLQPGQTVAIGRVLAANRVDGKLREAGRSTECLVLVRAEVVGPMDSRGQDQQQPTAGVIKNILQRLQR